MRKAGFFFLLICSNILSAKNTSVKSTKHTPLTQSQTGCAEPTAMVDLDINNVRASIFAGGDMWWNLVDANPQSKYEVPKGSGKTCLFAGSVWIGAYDNAGNIKVAAQSYRQSNSNDYFTGPISTLTGSPDVSATTCNAYDTLWKINRSDVVNFINTGVTTPDIASWPGNGNIANGELPQLAPYEDVNGDGIYNTADGDYPRYNFTNNFPIDTLSGEFNCNNYLFGDQTLWWVFNDVGNLKTETYSAAIGIEVRAQAFSFVTTNGINNCTFYNFQVINRTSITYDSTFFGMWTDWDLGDPSDDWLGCDSIRGLGYCYNSTNNDSSGFPNEYGLNPPSVGIDFLQGPIADINDGVDNDKDGIIDEAGEQIFMSNFMFYTGGFSNYGPPNLPYQFYNYLSGTWKNGDHWIFDNAQGMTSPNNGFPFTNYIYPGDPNGTGWTEASASNPGSDRRGVMSVGDFEMQPGEVNYITTSVIWAQGANNLQSVNAVKALDDTIQAWFATCFNPTVVGLHEINNVDAVTCYPNPMKNLTTITVADKRGISLTLTVYNSNGSIIEKQTSNTGTFIIQKKSKAAGVYLYQVSDGKSFKQSNKLLIE